MKYWILSLLLVLVSGVASAESIISSNLVDKEQKGSSTSYTWEVQADIRGWNGCYVRLELMDAQKNVTHKESVHFIDSADPKELRWKIIVVRNEVAAQWVYMNSTIRCY